MIKSLGADTIEEAACIIQAAGIQPADLNELMMD